MTSFQVITSKRSDMVDISHEISKIVANSGVRDGICTIFIPHTTASVTINENADPDVVKDMLTALDRQVPWDNGYHHYEGNAAAHIKSSMMGFSQQVLIQRGQLVLGTWQGIYFCEFDGPRHRKVHVMCQ